MTHAGHGTVMKALSHGLPLVCLPMGRDQNDNAVKVQHHGCGIALKAKSRPEKIRRAVNKILTESSFRQAAGSFQKDIMQNDQSNNILREIGNLMAPFNDREVAFSEERIRYA